MSWPLIIAFKNDEDVGCLCKRADCHLGPKQSERLRSYDKLLLVRKVSIMPHCAQRSGEGCSARVRVKVTVSHKIKLSPVKVSGPEHCRPGLSQGCTAEPGGALECILRDQHGSTF